MRKVIDKKLPNKVSGIIEKGFTSPTKNEKKSKIDNITVLNHKKISKILDVNFIIENYEKIDTNLLWRINFTIWIDELNIEV